MGVQTKVIISPFFLTGEETREDDRGKAERLHYKHGSENGTSVSQPMKEMLTDSP